MMKVAVQLVERERCRLLEVMHACVIVDDILSELHIPHLEDKNL